MSKLTIILCIVFIASATHAVYGQETFEQVKQRVWDTIKSEITKTKTRFDVSLRMANEIFNQLKEATTRYNETVTNRLTRPILKNARDEIEDLTLHYGNDFGCKNLAADLNGLEGIAINTTSVCIQDTLTLGYTFINNIIKGRDELIELLEGLKENVDECGIVYDGISDQATKCVISLISVTVDNMKISYNNISLIEPNLAKLTNMVNSAETSLTECTIDGLNDFIDKTTNVLAWTKQCFVQHTNEFHIIDQPTH